MARLGHQALQRVGAAERILLDDRRSMRRRSRRGSRPAARLRGRRTAGSDLLRSRAAALRNRHLRRPLSRHQQRDPGAGPRADPLVRREGHPRFSIRVRGAGAAIRPRAGAPRSGLGERDSREGRDRPGDVARQPGSGRDGRYPRGAKDWRPVRDRRRRDAAGRYQDRRRGPAARPLDRGDRNPQDDRQRHPLHRSQLRVRERVRRGGGGDSQRARRGDGGAQRNRPRQADGSTFGLHRVPRGARVDGRQLRPDPGGPGEARRRRGFLRSLERRLAERAHAVIVCAEGAGQDLCVDVSRR